MSKRPAEEFGDDGVKLRDGERPPRSENSDAVLDYADEFEDEYESEDEIFEAGVDGRPDNEKENEQKRGMWTTPETWCEFLPLFERPMILMTRRCNGCGPANFHTRSR